MSQHHLPLRRALALTTASLLLCGIVSTTGGASSAAPASGSDWTVTPVAGGYEVSLELSRALPMVSDAPTLVVDGTDLGLATTSADGLTLSVLTSDPSVIGATDVEAGWASGDDAKVEPSDSPVTSTDDPISPSKLTRKQLQRVAGDDGSTPGPYGYVQDDYDYGDQALPTAGLGGIRQELTGRIYLTKAEGPRPTVVLLHGRHTSCSTVVAGTQNPTRWPCVTGQTEVPSYKGYDGTGQTLATWGYNVVSISANAINANDAQLSVDNGALARGQLVLDSLAMIAKWSAGEPATYHDDARGTDLTTDGALDAKQADLGTVDLNQINARDLVGQFDLAHVGLMGHSRGGEGVTAAVTLNQALDKPWGIESVLPLAPVDFTRMTVGSTPTLVMLPYCDGDVSNQQGQHFIDDSRYAFDDSVLRSTVWAMGANHNFFNTVWTPGKYAYSTSDDWGATSTDAVCGPASTTNIRLSADDQYKLGTAYMSAWFRMTVGSPTAPADPEFLSMFDGSVKPAVASVPTADVRVLASAPADDRVDIEPFTSVTGKVRTVGSAVATVCASAGGRTLPQEKAYCATPGTVRSTSAMPHWTPASFAPNVPASPMLKYLWSNTTGTSAASVRITVPTAGRNAAAYDALTFKTAPDESVLTGTDLTLSVLDGSGGTWTSPVSALNPLAVKRMPSSTSTTLNKIVLQEVSVPISAMTGINTADIREVRLSAAQGADATETGGVYLSDLALSRSSVGTPVVEGSSPTINVDPTTAEEGSGADTKAVAVVLSKAAAVTTTGWLTLIGSTATTGKAGLVATKVSFAPGETCRAVEVPTFGDSVASSTPLTSYKTEISNQTGVVYGSKALGTLTVREDDGTVAPAPTTQVPNPPVPAPAAAVGVQGDVCAEAAAKATVFALTASTPTPAPSTLVSVSGSGFRAGESVSFTDSSTTPATTVATVLADADGMASAALTLPADATLGARTITARGSGSARQAATVLTVQVPVVAPEPTPAPAPTTPTTPTVPAPVAAAPAVLAPSAVTVKLLKVVTSGKVTKLRTKVKVVGASGAAKPTGFVALKLGKATKLVALPSSGILKVTLKRTGAKAKKVTVLYGGDTTYAAASTTSAKR